MENMYVTPKSDVSNPNERFKRSIWWKIYFFFISVFAFGGMISFLMSEGAGLVDVIEMILLCMATAGFFGFVFNKKVLFPRFWLPFLIIYFVSGFAYEPLSNVDMRQGLSDMEYYISAGFGLLISLPAYWALYSYSRPENEPWKNA